MAEGQPKGLTPEKIKSLVPQIEGAIATRQADLAGMLDGAGMLGFTLDRVAKLALEIGQWQGLRMGLLLAAGDQKLEDLEIGGRKGELAVKRSDDRPADTTGGHSIRPMD